MQLGDAVAALRHAQAHVRHVEDVGVLLGAELVSMLFFASRFGRQIFESCQSAFGTLRALDVSGIVTNSHYLERFVEAQALTYATVLRELARGHKTSHWMWFIFPQLRGLGSSETARRYAIASLDEARAYLAHPLLGSRLLECVTTLQDLPRAAPQEAFGDLDALKLRSSLTLFLRAGGGELFEAMLGRWFSGQADERTDSLLEKGQP